MPLRGPELSKAEFLQRFGADDGKTLGLRLLRDAVARQDDVDLEMALIVCGAFGVMANHELLTSILDVFVNLVAADWHQRHEEVVSTLDRLRSPDAVDALYLATWWVPPYLEWDSDGALAMKAVRALAKIPGDEAGRALEKVLETAGENARGKAREKLEQRKRE
jgi:hypothetical protein